MYTSLIQFYGDRHKSEGRRRQVWGFQTLIAWIIWYMLLLINLDFVVSQILSRPDAIVVYIECGGVFSAIMDYVGLEGLLVLRNS